ncbi:MAG TPA: hypothetical protein EYP17_07470 [Candidatus Latescibacteria bacterium]|nr:hypothetical protein [Candidatus Latescibacterota bacterium]
MRKGITVIGGLAMALCLMNSVEAQVETSFYPLTPSGVHVLVDALAPNLKKWYVPQELYYEYGWKGWEYTNYAKEPYARYVDIALEGRRWYDIFGDYITKGWEIFNWTEEQPHRLGSHLRKSPQFRNWFDNVVISRASKGEFYTALTVGDVIRTTLTPLVFSSPSFNGLQWDFISDKYAFTVLTTRITDPTEAASSETFPGVNVTNYTRFLGLRGVAQVGGYVKVGAHYVTAHNVRSDYDLRESSLKGVLTEGQNSGYIEKIVIRLSDDSPEDGVGGAALYGAKIIIDGREMPQITPSIEGGRLIGGVLRADGPEVIILTYDIKRAYETYNLGRYQNIEEIEFELVLANDYKVEVTSNLQTSYSGEPVFLPVARARGNVKDGSNQTFVRFMYGLPTGIDIMGTTLEIDNLAGLNLRAEYDLNGQFRRFPNQGLIRHKLEQDLAKAFYVTASYTSYPFFLYGELFNIDPEYTTTVFVSDERGEIYYDMISGYTFELVDDNDDQDRFPDWNRRNENQRAILAGIEGWDREVIPGYDENNDLISDFNQNQNLQPDYEEPFLRYNVDPPEYLFGLDMNNNGWIDRFENDHLPDYPYKKDHRGYNLYLGIEPFPGMRVMAGHLRERLLSSDRRSRSTYGLFTLLKDYPAVRIQVMYNPRRVRDDISDDLEQWVQPPGTKGQMKDIPDPMICQNTFVHTAYLQTDYRGVPDLNVTAKLKYEYYHQYTDMPDQKFFGAIVKGDYPIRVSKRLVLWPKWKTMYRRFVPSNPSVGPEAKEMSNIGFLIGKYGLLEGTWLQVGAEYTIYNNFLDKGKNYRGLVLAMQFSNTADYLGYRLTGNFGFRWERRAYEYGTEIGTTFFVTIYAGAGK